MFHGASRAVSASHLLIASALPQSLLFPVVAELQLPILLELPPVVVVCSAGDISQVIWIVRGNGRLLT